MGNVFQAKFMHACNDTTVVTTAADGQVRVIYLSSDGRVFRSTKQLAEHRGRAHKVQTC
jgi:WD repeat-containing protein 42A